LREKERGGREGERARRREKSKKNSREREEKTRNLSKPTHHLTAFSLFALE
jgi:hypothetical protein